ncbi:cell division protein FtsZ [bacterium]|uniref:Cell division protein FtsZ n=2 Tax=Katanobacteria TaxID=422282 RepID=A0A2H0BFF5_UNCKA|nr:cell division protein FtsZ [bacterium]PIP56381.1 MAG: cell division protein FtsZ [candidate division WWE3 bacterium CG22_combo_CG10-13_8_21_14_all_39_12]
MLIKPEVEKFAKIKVIGVGGGGSNSIKTMMEEQNIQGVEFIAVNTDAQHLASSPAPTKIQIGKQLTKGLGSGGNPEVGRGSAEESGSDIESFLDGTDMVFITAGMGGGTGSGAAPYIAEVARKKGALTVGVVTKPFSFEGARRMMNAEKSLEEMKDKVDALITIPNQRLLEIMDEGRPLIEAFKVADSVLGQSVQGISDIIVLPGLINRDFADVKSIMSNAGSALMGIGYGSGEDRAIKAAQEAINSPLLENSIDGAKGILFNVVGGMDLTLSEVNKAAEVISAAADPDANIIFGAAVNEESKDTIKITVIATGFDSPRMKDRTNIHARLRQQSPVSPTVMTPQSPVHMTEPDKKSDDDEYETPAFLRRR